MGAFGSRFAKNMLAMLRNLVDQDVYQFASAGTPVNGTSGTAAGIAGPGSTYVDTNTGIDYMNTGTKLSPTWTPGTIISGDVTVSSAGVSAIGANKIVTGLVATNLIQYASGTISSANLTGTSAGQFGHAQGVVLQAAPGANVALQPIAVATHYTFATAAYTAGGNTTLNWGAGGAALTGLVSAANSFAAASNKSVMFFPLSTVGVAVVSNASLNLVTSAAFTQPGTAAGTIFWELWYRTMAVGF